MTPCEQSIALDAASAGMVLSRDLLDAAGAVLLPAGATLSAASLASLRRRGIERLPVALAAAPADQAAALAERERRCRRLASLFRRSAGSGATGMLLEQLTTYRKGAGL